LQVYCSLRFWFLFESLFLGQETLTFITLLFYFHNLYQNRYAIGLDPNY
jgi:hypothetical protein